MNIKNEDDSCFKYCFQCGVNMIDEKDHPERMFVSLQETRWENVRFPTPTVDVESLRKQQVTRIKWQSPSFTWIMKASQLSEGQKAKAQLAN